MLNKRDVNNLEGLKYAILFDGEMATLRSAEERLRESQSKKIFLLTLTGSKQK